jgi:hypothetical protein
LRFKQFQLSIYSRKSTKPALAVGGASTVGKDMQPGDYVLQIIVEDPTKKAAANTRRNGLISKSQIKLSFPGKVKP